MAQVLPRPVGFADPAVQAWAERLTETVQQAIDDLAQATRVGIVVTNVTPPVGFDPPSATLAQTAQTLGALLKAMKVAGRVS